jgi:hypothetical protein
MKSSFRRVGGLAAALGWAATVSAQVLLGPTPYLSFADSPFSGAASFSYFHLENFEDNAFTPGWSANAGWVRALPGPLTDSVDGDDGAIDGSGAGGSSFYSGNVASLLSITFDAGALGALPTHVGVVWTDVGLSSPNLGLADVSFEAFDGAGASLGVLGPFVLGDGSAVSATAEDRFFGVIFSGGISRIELVSAGTVPNDIVGFDGSGSLLPALGSTDWEVDHLQYGRAAPVVAAVPEPSVTAIFAAGLLGTLGLLRLRRRANRAQPG